MRNPTKCACLVCEKIHIGTDGVAINSKFRVCVCDDCRLKITGEPAITQACRKGFDVSLHCAVKAAILGEVAGCQRRDHLCEYCTVGIDHGIGKKIEKKTTEANKLKLRE
jgi:hypothetical protein